MNKLQKMMSAMNNKFFSQIKLLTLFMILNICSLASENQDALKEHFIETPWEKNTSPDHPFSINTRANNRYPLHEGNVFTTFPQNNKNETRWEIPGPKHPPYVVKDAVITSSFDFPTYPAAPLPKALETHTEEVVEEEPVPEMVEITSPPLTHERGTYRLKIGDKLNISIYGEANTTRIVTVDSTGSIYYLFMDPILALGKTINELKIILNQQAKKEFKHALITVTAVSVGGEFYTILGEVINPGHKPIHGKETLLMAIGAAGGITRGAFRSQTIDFADLDRAFITRNGHYIPIDFAKLVHEGDITQNIELKSGDYIYLPPIMSKGIYVLGEVNAPTTLSYMNTMSLVEAIAEAQGLTINASSRIVVLRGSLTCPTQYLVDINRILRRCEPDFLLEPGDIVFAPPRRFTVLREIIRGAIAIFVSNLASVAGNQTYLSLNPGAVSSTFISPVIIPTATTSSTVIIP